MISDFKKIADEFLNSSKLNKGELNNVIKSADGQKVKDMLESSDIDIMGAVRNNDIDTLKNALSSILKTEEGARLAEQITKIVN